MHSWVRTVGDDHREQRVAQVLEHAARVLPHLELEPRSFKQTGAQDEGMSPRGETHGSCSPLEKTMLVASVMRLPPSPTRAH